MHIYIDDGSTNVKMQWREGKELKTLISPNSFINRWQPVGIGSENPQNYLIDGMRYSYDQNNPDAQKTTNVAYQYGQICAVAIHHALHKSGIEPQPVDITVTLPVAEYYDQNTQKNVLNIERKREQLMKPVTLDDPDLPVFTIKSVTVKPESIPAAIAIYDTLESFESVLVVDLGGTTLDLSQMNGGSAGVSAVAGYPTVGVAVVTNKVMAALMAKGIDCSPLIANTIIENRHDTKMLARFARNEKNVPDLLKAIEEGVTELQSAVLQAMTMFKGFSHILIIGGGAQLVAGAIRGRYEQFVTDIIIPEQSQTALVNALRTIGEF